MTPRFTFARAFRAVLVVLAALLLSSTASAFTPPSIEGHVTDTAGKLTTEDRAFLNAKLDAYRKASSFEIAVFVVGSLEGETIDDVTYTTFNTWKIGKKGADNGVLLVIAPSERKVRIETGKGVGGELTDIESAEIIRNRIGPRLKEEKFRAAISDGVDAIAAALGPGTPSQKRQADSGPGTVRTVVTLLVIIILFIVIFRLARRGGGGGGSGAGGAFFIGGLGGGGWGDGGGGGGGGWGGGDGGGGYSGGGGESGGGGASGDY